MFWNNFTTIFWLLRFINDILKDKTYDRKKLKHCILMIPYHIWHKLMFSQKILILRVILLWKSLILEGFILAPVAVSSVSSLCTIFMCYVHSFLPLSLFLYVYLCLFVRHLKQVWLFAIRQTGHQSFGFVTDLPYSFDCDTSPSKPSQEMFT